MQRSLFAQAQTNNPAHKVQVEARLKAFMRQHPGGRWLLQQARDLDTTGRVMNDATLPGFLCCVFFHYSMRGCCVKG